MAQIDLQDKPDGKHARLEKYLLRKAFDVPENPYLPDEVLYRQKEQVRRSSPPLPLVRLASERSAGRLECAECCPRSGPTAAANRSGPCTLCCCLRARVG